MVHKKVCMVGAFATGKTSLVSQFVDGIYSEKYQTTIGVKIAKRVVETEERTINMVLWDIHGEDEFQNVRMSYLRGTAGYLLVVDGTRRASLDIALNLRAKVIASIGHIPCVIVVNKADLQDTWEVTNNDIQDLQENVLPVIKSSAKTGMGVNDSFLALSHLMMQGVS
ncbi:MAG: Rab family GTPase [Cyanobacteria bacterium P01_F01_bin.116]